MKLASLTALVLAIAANIGANAAWKSAVSSLSPRASESSLVQLLRNGYLWIGVALVAVLLVSYLVAIRQIPISVAYVAVSALAMVGLVVVDSTFFGLKLGVHNLLGHRTGDPGFGVARERSAAAVTPNLAAHFPPVRVASRRFTTCR
jgi:multidrug transporter EmrE-like cation transporter